MNLHKQKYPTTLNLSCPGSGPLIQYGIFREYIAKLNQEMFCGYIFRMI